MNILHHQTRLALGSDTTLVIVADENDAVITELFNKLWVTIYRFERQFSRFIPGSELSAFNRQAGNKVPISPEFREVLLVAKQLSYDTKGLFNPFILPALHKAGYKKSFVDSYASDLQEDYSGRRVVTIEKLKIDGLTASIPYGTALDLGGCGKGYLADLLAKTVVPEWVQGYWLSFGGDIVGDGFDENGKPWDVHIADNTAKGKGRAFVTSGKHFAVATSGTTIRKGKESGKDWHHLIDPRTLKPSKSDIMMATVLCDSVVQADVLASCAVILGSKLAVSFLRQQGAQAVYLQKNDGTNTWHNFESNSIRSAGKKIKEKVGQNA